MDAIENILKNKQHRQKDTVEELFFKLLQKNDVILNNKEKQTFSFYLKNCGEKAFEIANGLLKDQNEKTFNIKGRIISELKKMNITETVPTIIGDDIFTNIRLRYMPIFSPSNRRKKGTIDEAGKLVIKKFDTLNGSLTQYHRDLTHFDEKVLYLLCTMSKEQKSRKIKFTLKGLCRTLKIDIGGKGIKKIVESISSLSSAEFVIRDFLLKDNVKIHKNFRFLERYYLIEESEKSKILKSYVFLNETLFEHLLDKKYIKKMNKKYFDLTDGYEFKIFNYLDVLNKKVITLKLETVLVNGLSVEKKILNDAKKLKNILMQIKRALINLKEKKYIKDFKIEGRGKDKKYTFYF